jgi:hypothetical protein
LDAVFILECKATQSPVGSAEVGWFVRKLQVRGIHYGILIALNGITGTVDGNSSAHSEIFAALMRDGIKILMLTRSELVDIANTSDLASLLKRKLLWLTLERSVHIS